MQLISRSIIATGIALGGISMLYFLSLVLRLPFAVALLFILGVPGAFVWWFFKKTQAAADEQSYITRLPLNILLTGVALIVVKSQSLALKYGGWDAWTIWNYHARFMASADHWTNLFSGTIDHPDYPLLVPALNGFFLRLSAGAGATMIPFIFSFTVTLFIPVLIYMETRLQSIIAAAAIFLLMAGDNFFLQNSLTQYADAPLAFFFLGALVCITYAENDRKYLVLAAACLGCCAWTKNEGIILAVVFITFYLRVFFSPKNLLYTLVGLIIPLVTLFVFKRFYAPSNDIVSKQGLATWHQLFMVDRYKLVWSHFVQELDQNFYYAKVGFALYVLLCLLGKKWPGKQFLMVTTCIAAYLMVYILSTKDLEWHLATSLGRLLLQLMPAMMFVFARKFAGGKISFVTQKPF